MQSAQQEADEHSAQQVADDVDEQKGRHDGIAVEVVPERVELRGAPNLVNIVGQSVEAHERSPGDPADQGERRRDGGEPGCAPHTQERHTQVTQGQEEGGGDDADEVQGVADRTGHCTGYEWRERRALISCPGDEVECDTHRCQDDTGRKGIALEGVSAGKSRLIPLRCR